MPTPNSDVVIADRLSDANQIRIRGTTGLTVSWELSRAGQLACEVPLRDLATLYGIANPSDLLSRWVHYEHPTAGHWGGIVTNVTPSDGIVTIGAESWAAAYRGVGVKSTEATTWGLIGQLIRQIDLAKTKTGISRGVFDTKDHDVTVVDEAIQNGQDLYESFIPSVLERWSAAFSWHGPLQSAGWNVDPVTRRFNFDPTYGVDRSSSVALRDGYHVTSAELSDDTTDVFNTAIIAGKVNYRYTETVKHLSRKGKKTTTKITRTGVRNNEASAVSQASYARHGEHVIRINEDHPSAASAQNAATQRVAWLSRNQQNVSIETADVDGVWSRFREGDIVWAGLANEGAEGKMVVRIRALNVARGTMIVAGEAELS